MIVERALMVIYVVSLGSVSLSASVRRYLSKRFCLFILELCINPCNIIEVLIPRPGEGDFRIATHSARGRELSILRIHASFRQSVMRSRL